MEHILIMRDIEEVMEVEGKTIVFETNRIDNIENIRDTVSENNRLFCVKLRLNQEITSIVFKEEWQNIPLVFYPTGLGNVRDLIGALPLIRKPNIKFFLDGGKEQNYEAVQILSSLGVHSGILINENADWEKLTDLMYYALCGKVPHAPIEPFQYLYDIYNRNTIADYDAVFFNDTDVFECFTTKDTKNHPLPPPKEGNAWQEFCYEASPCAACEGWRICLGKYAALEDKTECRNFTGKWLNLIENIKFKEPTG
ncbi:MAG: hypothetical protein FWF70_03420 [Bacteroidetes bacterium]|nr:hypothetical protein [Bacteroidota bacterium]MCL1968137.1 hypothetical protein [Bacteroidota bacterium]